MERKFEYNIRTIKDGVDSIVRKHIIANTLPRIGETVAFYCKEENFHGFKNFKVVDVKHTLFIVQNSVEELIAVYI